jgi:hypothetical protein
MLFRPMFYAEKFQRWCCLLLEQCSNFIGKPQVNVILIFGRWQDFDGNAVAVEELPKTVVL